VFTGKRILVAPLDWGLGHSTRCIPVIHALLERGAVPILGADNGPLAVKAILATLRETEMLDEPAAFEIEQRHGMQVMMSKDAVEGPRAFLEKRKPNFQGK